MQLYIQSSINAVAPQIFPRHAAGRGHGYILLGGEERWTPFLHSENMSPWAAASVFTQEDGCG